MNTYIYIYVSIYIYLFCKYIYIHLHTMTLRSTNWLMRIELADTCKKTQSFFEVCFLRSSKRKLKSNIYFQHHCFRKKQGGSPKKRTGVAAMSERWRFQQGRTEKRCPSNARNALKANRVVRPTVERLQLGFPQWW